MLYIDLVYSAILLVVANLAARFRPGAVLEVLTAAAVGSAVLPCLCMAFLPPAILHTTLTAIAAAWWRYTGRGPGRFLGLSLAAMAVTYAVVAVPAAQRELELRRLQHHYPFESMEDRVPPLPSRPDAAPAFDAEPLEALEHAIHDRNGYAAPEHLRRLHEERVRQFVNSPGFGVIRMMGWLPSEHAIRESYRSGPAPPQPGGPLSPPLPPLDILALPELHQSAALEFVHPQGFGYVKDRAHVAGFQSHRFGEVPASIAPVAVARVELVSLLLHDAPAVYASDRLPAMNELVGVPTRPLDDFEAGALAKLRRGEELVVDGARMLGALRNAKQCIACHGGERGELLGALSYGLRGR